MHNRPFTGLEMPEVASPRPVAPDREANAAIVTRLTSRQAPPSLWPQAAAVSQ